MGEEDINWIKIKLALAVGAKEHKEVEEQLLLSRRLVGEGKDKQTFKE